MARKRVKNSLYGCVVPCTFDVVDERGDAYQKHFKAMDSLENDYQLVEGGVSESDCLLEVPAGELVCKHFIPQNEQAEDDREDQLESPANFIKSERDVTLIGELMVKEGWFKATYKTVDNKRVVVESALERARAAIKARDDINSDDIVSAGANVQRELAVKAMLEQADNDKALRKALMPILKDAGIKMFGGADPRAIAERIYDEGLYKA